MLVSGLVADDWAHPHFQSFLLTAALRHRDPAPPSSAPFSLKSVHCERSHDRDGP